MRIIYLHQYFKTPAMSGGTRSFEMARRFAGAGHQVEMVTTDMSGGKKSGWVTTREAGIRVHRLPLAYSNHMDYRSRIHTFLTFALQAARKIRTLDGDVILASSTPLTIALPAVYGKKRKRIPMVFEVRDLWPEIPIAAGVLKRWPAIWMARKLEQFAYRHSEHVVALSPYMAQGVAAAGYPSDAISIIPNCADSDFFSVPDSTGKAFRDRFNWLGSRPLVVYTGTLGLINNVGYLAEIASVMQKRDPEVRFLVTGDGAEWDTIHRKARKLGVLDHNFFMRKAVPKTEIPAILNAADVACSLVRDLEELEGNSANKFFDALAASTPVMINHGGWQARLLEKHAAGLVCPPSDSPKAAEQLHAFLNDKKALSAAGIAAGKLAREEFDIDRQATRLLQVLEHAAGAQNIPREHPQNSEFPSR